MCEGSSALFRVQHLVSGNKEPEKLRENWRRLLLTWICCSMWKTCAWYASPHLLKEKPRE